MRLTPQEEFGLRCLLAVQRAAPDGAEEPVSIERIADGEGLGYEHTAKIMRLLRRGGLVESTRGVNGGYRLARPADRISLWETLVALDTPLVGNEFCAAFAGQMDTCTHSTSHCNLKTLWSWVGSALEQGLSKVTLADLAAGRVPATLFQEAM